MNCLTFPTPWFAICNLCNIILLGRLRRVSPRDTICSWWVLVIILGGTISVSCHVRADEGMWLFNDLPGDLLSQQHGFEPDEAWSDHIRLASVRFNVGGSASFISSRGLVLTNHHVASDTLHKVSSAEKNYVERGFLARTLEEEIKAPDLELNQLVSIEDVTDRVNQAVPANLSPAEAFKARQAVMAQIEQESLDATGLRSDVVTLYGGAKYHLYRYKKYTDVRLVWAPEEAIAMFGGDADNFEYPRYCLDATIFRVYEDGQPAKTPHFLRWSEDGPQDGELVFVSGNPGRTQRIFTTAALKYLRDHRLPFALNLLRRREIVLQQYALDGEEQERRGRDDLLSVQNSRKAYTGMLQGLQNPDFFQRKEQTEEQFLDRLKHSAHDKLADAWNEIADVQRKRQEILGQTATLGSTTFGHAQTLYLMAFEDLKPSPERLREYRDSNRESLEQALFSPAPIYPDLETVLLADSLSYLCERRGGDDLLVKALLAGKGPRVRAAEVIAGTRLLDPEERKRYAAGGVDSVKTSTDPLIEMARILDPEFRRLRQITDELDERERQAYAKVTEAKVLLEGTSGYPDATFTLRLAFGTVRGYQQDGTLVPPWTTVEGAFQHESNHKSRAPWKLPESWHRRRQAIAGSTPFNFVCTADIIGGNSGSPVVNRKGELVGLIFDGNLQSLTSDFFYDDTEGRAVAVHSSVIRAALRDIYGADALARELGH